MTSWATPTDAAIDKAVAKLTRPELVAYFFRNLTNPHWLRPLQARGFFKDPPPPVKEEQGWISPPWPQVDYLVAIAAVSPARVADLIVSIETENWNVQFGLIDAVLKLPSALAAPMGPRFGKWLKGRFRHPLLHDKLADLTVHLAQGGQGVSAIRLAKQILDVVPPKPRESEYFPAPPRGLVDDWEYRELLEKLTHPLRVAVPEEFSSLLGMLLQKSVRLGIRANRGDGQGTEDSSHWWRPAVENHGQNSAGDVRDVLIEGFRDDLLAAIRAQRIAVTDAWSDLLGRPYVIFHRIALSILATIDQPPTELVRAAILGHNWFNDIRVHHEYYRLVERHYETLTEADREAFLKLIEVGGQTIDDGRDAEWWEYRQLWPVRAHLGGRWLERLQVFREKLGELEHPDFLSFFTTGSEWVGSASPISANELAQLSVDEILAFLREWQPESATPDGPNFNGLAREVTTLVQGEPARFATTAPKVSGLALAFQQAFVDGFRAAARAGSPFEWGPVLEFVSSIATSDQVPERRYLLQCIAGLVSAGLNKGASEIPVSLRERVWAVLSVLCEHPDPFSEDELDVGDDTARPENRSINTVRGEAMHAAVGYGLWIRRAQEGAKNTDLIESGLNAMPELRATLEAHLNVSHDASTAIRSVYGQWLPWLRLIDPHWTTSKLGLVFPSSPEHAGLRKAAWDTYIRLCPPYNLMLPMLRSQYREAIEALAHVPASTAERTRDTTGKLAEHLLAYYWRGEDALELQDSLVRRFYDAAPPWLRGRATHFLGRSLRRSKEPVPEAVQERLIALWDWRLDQLSQEPLEDEARMELDGFAHWVASGNLPSHWTASRLAKVAQLVSSPGRDLMFALDCMVELARTEPEAIAAALEVLVQKDQEVWHTATWADRIAEVMRVLASSGVEDAVLAVRQTAEVLGRRGLLQFREFAEA